MLARNLLTASGQRQILVTISANVRSPNIAALATAQGWSGSENITLTVNAGVDVATLQISGIPDDRLHIINNGRIGGVQSNGGVGGTGLYTRTRIRITNNGTIFGGGGQGGYGGSASWSYASSSGTGVGGAGGNGAGFSLSGTVTFVNRNTNPTAGGGTYSAYDGATFPGDTAPWAGGGSGALGGDIGVAGGTGTAASSGGTGAGAPGSGTAGALAGYYVDGNSYITWLATGSRLGRVI
ncbi:hypothetical protein [Delftia sp. HK171]|uniref:hypothetical protein n=1 Tax=Delftia sp. HK171 TaxID=1920191 RepID=UPI00114D8B17|nr:hypothetical protein [Delftia sp. HK171]TQL83074.1 hypothetical protein FB549_0561 [Delftia sp. HK171]